MKIVYVRYGQPDYKTDTLTPLGRLQAAAAAKQLRAFGITEIYSSPLGRARETAQFAADELGLDVTVIDNFRELGWGDLNAEQGARKITPWEFAHRFAAEGKGLTDTDWREKEPWYHNKVVERVQIATDGFDAFMEQRGYRREGEYYRVIGEKSDKTIAIFGHGGHSTAIFSHMMNVPFPLACHLFRLDFTNISVFCFNSNEGDYVVPRFDMIGNAEHIHGIEAPLAFME